MDRYEYTGQVLSFGKIISYNYKASTMAASEKKARSNILYQYKVNNGLKPNTKIEMPGQLKIVS